MKSLNVLLGELNVEVGEETGPLVLGQVGAVGVGGVDLFRRG